MEDGDGRGGLEDGDCRGGGGGWRMMAGQFGGR